MTTPPPTAPTGGPHGAADDAPQAPGPAPEAGPDPGRDRTGAEQFFDSVRRSPVQRSDDRWAGGVCAGLAERIGVDAVVVRVAVIVLSVLGGVPAVLYGVAWLLLPDRHGRIEAEAVSRGDVSAGAVVAGVLVLCAGWLPRPWQLWWPGADPGWDGGPLAALVLVAVVVSAIWWLPRVVESSRTHAPAAGPATGPATGPAAGPPGTPTGRPAGSRTAPRPAEWARHGDAGSGPPPRRPRRRGPGPLLTTAVVGVALVAAGLAATWALQGGLDLPTRLAAALAAGAVLGLAVVALGVAGRTDGTVGLLAVVVTCLALWWSVVPGDARVAFADASYTPTGRSDAARGHVTLFGDSRVDLTDVPADADDALVVPLRAGVGRVEVVVPDDVPVTVRVQAVVGGTDAATVPDGWTRSGLTGGVGADAELRNAARARGEDGGLVVEVSALVGDVDVVEEGSR
ncbi:PspC domain-containing protein [Thalassiella azotivora]